MTRWIRLCPAVYTLEDIPHDRLLVAGCGNNFRRSLRLSSHRDHRSSAAIDFVLLGRGNFASFLAILLVHVIHADHSCFNDVTLVVDW